MKAVITVTGKDTVGIIAAVSTECAQSQVNIVDITQTVLADYFVMIMLVNIDGLKGDFGATYTPCTRKYSTPCTAYRQYTEQACMHGAYKSKSSAGTAKGGILSRSMY